MKTSLPFLLAFFLFAGTAHAQILINEIDADQTFTDDAEFVELYDGGAGNTDLSGLVLVFFNGSDDASYEPVFDLDGFTTDANGFFVVCGDAANVPNCDLEVGPGTTNLIQNGADAVALFTGDAADFPNDTPVTTTNLVDAVVYGTSDADDAGLLVLLEAGEAQLDENATGNKDTESLQRIPDGAGGARITSEFQTALPTPGDPNMPTGTRVQFETDSQTVAETDGAVTINVTITNPDALNATTVEVALTGGTATNGTDITLFSTETLTFPAGDATPQSFTVTITDDMDVESTETLEFTLQNPMGGDNADVGSPALFTLSITDDDGGPPPPPPDVLINEIDADQTGTDNAEFVELYDGGVGNTALDGLVLVFFNGSDDSSYEPAFDLDGFSTNADGFFVVCGDAANVPNCDLEVGPGTTNLIQNGQDAVTLFQGDAVDFPNDTPLTTTNLIDAVIYGTDDGDDAGLAPLINPGEPQLNENATGNKDTESLQRFPDGSGGARNTNTFITAPPTPGEAGPMEAPPTTLQFASSGATVVEGEGFVTFYVTITNPDAANAATVDVVFTGGTATNGKDIGRFDPVTLTFPAGSDDPQPFTVAVEPDFDEEGTEVANFALINPMGGSMARLGLPRGFALTIVDDDVPPPPVVINEIDADQTGLDEAEFIELYDGGVGNTDLSELVLVLFNGSDDASYAAFDLDGFSTDADGFFVLCGNAANVPNCDLDVEPNDNLVQNGADAVALFVGTAESFPEDTPLTTAGLVDAVVYGTSDDTDDGLLPLLEPGQFQLDENVNGTKDTESLQRIPDGAGGPRVTSEFMVGLPTPGAANAAGGEEGGGETGEGGTATLANASGGALDGTDVFRSGRSDQSVAVTVTGPDMGTLTDVTVTVPDAWTGLDAANVTLSGDGFAAATATVDGQTVTITGASVTATETGTATLGGLTTPTPTDATDDGRYTFTVATGSGGTVMDLDASPEAFVTIPLASIRDVDSEGVPLDLGETVAVEAVATVPSGAFDGDNLLVYVQDATGGTALFNFSINPTIIEGETYVVKGEVSQFNGLTELVPGSEADVIDLGPGTPVAPMELSIADILADAEGLEGTLVTILSADRVDGDWPGEGSSADITITDDGGVHTLNLRIDSDTDIDGSTEPVFPIMITGVLGQFDSSSPFTSGYQIQPRSTADVGQGVTETRVQFEMSAETVSESAGEVTVNVTILNPDPANDTTVDVALTGGTATDGVDVEAFTTTTLTFPAGSDAAQSFTVTVIDDDEAEDAETVIFELQNAAGGDMAAVGSRGTFTLTILDDDVPPPTVLINEIDADQTGLDEAEFIELYDGGVGNTPLDGLSIVLFNGSDDASYAAFDLDGFTTDADGFFVLCGNAANVPNCDLDVEPDDNLVQNGADAVALFQADADLFPEDTPVTTAGLVDAVVYGTSDPEDEGLLPLLNEGQFQLDENVNGTKDTESLQRIPDGAGGARNTSAFEVGPPSPGAPNAVVTDTRVQFEGSGAEIGEADGSVTIEVTILNPDPANDTTVDVALTGGTATNGVDVEAFTTTTLTFPAGDASPQSFTVTVIDDDEAEEDETLVFELQNVAGGTNAEAGTTSSFTLTILDDDRDLRLPIGEARALPDGSRVQIAGIVTRARGAFAYVQDETGGMTLRQTEGPFFDAVASGDVAPGDSLSVTGFLSEFAALREINEADIESFEVLSRGNDLPEPVTLTLEEIAAGGEQYEAMLIRTNIIDILAEGVFEAATTYDVQDVTVGPGVVTLRVPNADDTVVDGLPIPPSAIFEGVLGQFSFGEPDVGYQLMAIEETDVMEVVIDAVEGDETLPETFTVNGNYPNPFNPSTTIHFDLPAPAQVTIEVFDVMGRRVMSLPEQAFSAGRARTVRLDAGRLSSGVYVYRVIARMDAQTQIGTGLMTLLK
ncbi:Calx-beta domain-containing protein [Rhodocaloribacter sp.]